jgi:hypothetical protein
MPDATDRDTKHVTDRDTDHQVNSPVSFPYVTVKEEAPSGEIVVRRYPVDTNTSDATDGATGGATSH